MPDSDAPTNDDEENQQARGAATPSGSPGGAAQTQTVRLDESNVQACYANFCRVSSTPEEMILDMGLNPQPFAIGETVVPVAQRIIMNHYTAKRLLAALSMAVQRHEQAFGVLETDIRKRVRQT